MFKKLTDNQLIMFTRHTTDEIFNRFTHGNRTNSSGQCIYALHKIYCWIPFDCKATENMCSSKNWILQLCTWTCGSTAQDVLIWTWRSPPCCSLDRRRCSTGRWTRLPGSTGARRGRGCPDPWSRSDTWSFRPEWPVWLGGGRGRVRNRGCWHVGK